jgi:hypothetical protein
MTIADMTIMIGHQLPNEPIIPKSVSVPDQVPARDIPSTMIRGMMMIRDTNRRIGQL